MEGSRNSESLASLHIGSGGRMRVTSIAPHSWAGKMEIVPLHLLAPALTATGAPHPKSTSKQGNLEDPVTPKSYVRLKLYLKYLFPCRPTQSWSSCTLVEFALCLMAACTDLAANPRSLDPSSPAAEPYIGCPYPCPCPPIPMGFGWAWVRCYCSWVGMDGHRFYASLHPTPYRNQTSRMQGIC